MFRTNLWCYLWDLADEGVDAALDRIQGVVGASGISVATSYHSVSQLRPREGVSPREFHSPGGVWFQPESSHYSASRLKPVVGGWLRSRNPLKQIAEGCVQRGLDLRSWTVCCHSSLLAGRHPEYACKNVFGDANPTWLCPANPDVAGYLRGLVSDLSNNYAFDTIELEAPTWPEPLHGHGHEKVGTLPGPVERFLLGLCFCESCRQFAAKAEVDVEAASRRAKVALESFFKTDETVQAGTGEFVGEHAGLSDYVAWRYSITDQLILSLKQACRCRLLTYDPGSRIESGMDWFRSGRHVDGQMGLAYSDRPEAVDLAHRAFQESDPGSGVFEIGLNATDSYTPDGPTLVRHLTRAAELGIPSANIYNYGLLSETRLNWVHQAIRSARRVNA
jgi:hypothetical protein